MERKRKYIRDNEKIIAFGARLREIRQKKGMSMQELADLSNIEYSQISRIEKGVINTSLSNVFAIADALSIQAQILFETME